MKNLVCCDNCKHDEECDEDEMYIECFDEGECKYVNEINNTYNIYSLFEPLDNIKQHYKLKENEMEYLVCCDNCKHDGDINDGDCNIIGSDMPTECLNSGECKYTNGIKYGENIYSLFEPLDNIKQHYKLKKQNKIKQTEIHWKEINNKVKIVDIKNCLTLEKVDKIKGVDYRYLQEDECRYYWSEDKDCLFLYDINNNLYKLKIGYDYEIRYFITYIDNMKKAGIRMAEILKHKRELSNKINITKI